METTLKTQLSLNVLQCEIGFVDTLICSGQLIFHYICY